MAAVECRLYVLTPSAGCRDNDVRMKMMKFGNTEKSSPPLLVQRTILQSVRSVLNVCFYYYYRYCIIYPSEYPYVRILCLKCGGGGGSLKEAKRNKAGYCHPLGHRRFPNTAGGVKFGGASTQG